MEVFEIVIALLLGGVMLASVARRISVPYPALVAIAGAALALIPRVPDLVLDPELALALFVAPVLLDAAFDASQRDLRKHWRVVTSLALGAVALTVLLVAVVAHALVPGLPWWAAVALGAIVAPPDAAAATAVLKQLRPPHRLLVILEGESLFNDASALLIYRFAVGAVATGFISGWAFAATLVVVSIGSFALAWVLSRVIGWITARIHDVPTAVVFQFCSTFGVWILAENLHLSGILTMVAFAMMISRPAAQSIPARIRVPSYAVWEFAVFVLNILAFILVGFQLRQIVARAGWTQYIRVALIVCAVVIVARLVWVSGAAYFSRWRCRPRGDQPPQAIDALSLSGPAAAVVGWCGMRGTVTLAAALALPVGFPHRDLIFFTSFTVVLTTLVVQGVTLKPLLRWLDVRDDGAIEREIQLARVETLRAALDAAQACGGETADVLRRRYELRLRVAEREPDANDHVFADEADVVRIATAAERRRLIALRDDGTISDTAFQVIEQELDRKELELLEFAQHQV
jgi:monovalent cation/hydrogen antiporter